ncbi:hypothetical protein BS17DRAFT_773405, partial [Gyrodon lividus]
NTIITMLDSGRSAHYVATSTLTQVPVLYCTGFHTSTISRLCAKECSELQKSTGGHPFKLSPANVCHAIHLISTRKAENAVQIIKHLTNIINQPLHPNTFKGCSQAKMPPSLCQTL